MCEQRKHGSVGAGAGNRPGYPSSWPAGAPRRRGCLTPSWSSRPSAGTFTAKYKLEILAKADACTQPGEIGELLRREGLYTSHLTYWRKQRQRMAR